MNTHWYIKLFTYTLFCEWER